MLRGNKVKFDKHYVINSFEYEFKMNMVLLLYNKLFEYIIPTWFYYLNQSHSIFMNLHKGKDI